jgi:acetyl-CoA carboxylase biotin carboxyl carrier protein
MDRERIQQVIALLKGSASVELSVREGDTLVRVRRMPLAPPPAAVPAAGSAAGEPREAGAPLAGDVLTTARLVGRFYHGKAPGQPPLVKIGDRVTEDQIIGTVEALGKYTGVTAPATGDVIEYMAEDGQAVNYGAALIRLRKPEG